MQPFNPLLIIPVLGLGVPAILLLWAFYRLVTRGRLGVTGALWVGGFMGLMIATAGGALLPQIVRIADPLVCTGDVSIGSSRFSYKPGQTGVQHTVTCDASDGSPPRDITFRAVAVAALLYGALAFALLLAGGVLSRLLETLRGKAPGVAQDLQDPLIDPSARTSTSVHGVTQSWLVGNGEAIPSEAMAILQGALQGADHDNVGYKAIAAAIGSHPSPTSDAGDRLQSLASLYEKGLLTTSEYQAKRAEILGAL